MVILGTGKYPIETRGVARPVKLAHKPPPEAKPQRKTVRNKLISRLEKTTASARKLAAKPVKNDGEDAKPKLTKDEKEKIAKLQSLKPTADGKYELNALMSEALEKELQNVMIKVWQELPDSPPTGAEKLVADKFRTDLGDDLKNVLGLNVTKRILDVMNPLYVKIEFDQKPYGEFIQRFLRWLNCSAMKRVMDGQHTYIAQLRKISDLDRVINKPVIRIGGLKAKITPYYKFTKCPSKLETIYKTSVRNTVKAKTENDGKESKAESNKKEDIKDAIKNETTDKKTTKAVTAAKPAQTTNKPAQTPNKPTSTPNNPTQSPNNPTQTPNKPTPTPNKPTPTPNNPTQTPNKPTPTPNKPTPTPNNPAETPNKPTPTPNKPTPTPNNPAETPNKPTPTPNKPTPTPNNPAETPNKPTPTPNKPTPTPNIPADVPKKPTQTPNNPTQTPNKPIPTQNNPTPTPNKPTPTPNNPTDTPKKPTQTPNKPTPSPNKPTDTPKKLTQSPSKPTQTPKSAITKSVSETPKTVEQPNKTETKETPKIAEQTKTKPVVKTPATSKPNVVNTTQTTGKVVTPKKAVTKTTPPAKLSNQVSTVKEKAKTGKVTTKPAANKLNTTNPVAKVAPSKTKQKKKSDFDELDDEDILALMSNAIVLDECAGSDDD